MFSIWKWLLKCVVELQGKDVEYGDEPLSDSDILTVEKLKKDNLELRKRYILMLDILLYVYFLFIACNSRLLSFSGLMFLGYRLERKEEEILGEVLQALQHEKDKCKSLETQVCAVAFYLLGIYLKNKRSGHCLV